MYARTALTGIARQHAELYIKYIYLVYIPCTWKKFATNLIERFTVRGLEIRTRQQLYDLKMQGRDVLKYITEFQTLLGTVTVNDESERIFLFVHGLDSRTQQEVMYKNPRTFKDAADISCAYLNAHVPLSASVNVPTSSITPMEMDTLATENVNVVQSRRSPSRTFSRSRRRFSRSSRSIGNNHNNAFKRFSYSSTHRSRSPMKGRTSPLRCYQCGSRDHLQRECPNFRGSGHSNSPRGRNSSRNYNRTRSSSHGSIHILTTRGRSDSSVSSRTSSTDSRTSIKSGVLALTPLFTFSGKLWKKDVHVILDSGATENFVNAKITRECEAKQYSLEHPINVKAANGSKLRVTKFTRGKLTLPTMQETYDLRMEIPLRVVDMEPDCSGNGRHISLNLS